ncbi:uncharacterized protein C5orf52 homolog isoform X2 [Meles meles]|uniref:uncharacterized protein C5orf52 homolog isoform X2 n=1 Tax=Meles meles TaxID=9662 RepID=UPI001E69C9C6|nr:uncharacterized protein C5orf52 homolog isoform X2 [Meles meles]
MVDSAAQQSRPSVTWNLGSPSVLSASQGTTSSGTTPTWTSPHVRFISQPEIHVATHPQICFLRPRTTQQPVLFRSPEPKRPQLRLPGEAGIPISYLRIFGISPDLQSPRMDVA